MGLQIDHVKQRCFAPRDPYERHPLATQNGHFNKYYKILVLIK